MSRFASTAAAAAITRRVVVTGMGVVTCLGVGLDVIWKKLLNGESGISNIRGAGFDKIPSQVAGYVPKGGNPGELNLDKLVSSSELRSLPLAVIFALTAAEEALTMAEWKPTDALQRQRTGVAIGTGMANLEEIVDTGATLRSKGYKGVSPIFIPKILINMAAGHVSIKYGFQGPNHAVSTACATGLHAIGDAFNFVQRGDADVMVAGGTEACIGPLAMAGFARMRALSTKFNDTPEFASRPFDKQRDGFVMAEGAGIMVLEDYDHALERGAAIYGEILGYGLSGDANHITAPTEDGDGAYRCMAAALEHAGLSETTVGYINAHATSTPLGDEAEAQAIYRLLGSHAAEVPVSSTKGAVGHTLGAAGAVEAVFTLNACHTGEIPPTANLKEPDVSTGLYLVKDSSLVWAETSSDWKVALTNSFGFGGTNACLCMANLVF